MMFSITQLFLFVLSLKFVQSTPLAQRSTSYNQTLLPWERTSSTGYGTLTTQVQDNGAVLRVTINNPPINLYGVKLLNDMSQFLNSLVPGSTNVSTPAPKVVIFASALPGFWMSTTNPYDTATSNALFNLAVAAPALLRTLPTIFIAEIDGRATGSGNEFLVQCDMGFAGPDAIVGSLEVAIGGLEGNGGIQYVVRRLGMARAAEYLLSSASLDAETAAEVGWVNRAYKTSQQLTTSVNALASRIALFDAGALNATKTGIRANGPSSDQVAADIASILRLFPEEQVLLPKWLTLSQNLTANEFTLGALRSVGEVEKLYQ
ncbi:hypothetical protein D0Z07_6117 [Hyphodiscus hymeniophilus]|uniref:ClpP/crotonase n=1 Tax=Hyphodiscus hymeniophilus TaxID=353542 RepID=A0A9P6VFA0_9HELO|nr:hypothetical protein D0Z07_6117 [Hyphodiscus hymeniophilus]